MQNYQPTSPRRIEVDSIRLREKGKNSRGFALGEKAFNPEEFAELVASIKAHGDVFQAITVRPRAGATGLYEVISGERRFRAAQQLELTHISAEICDFTDAQAEAVVLQENALRSDLQKADRVLFTLKALAGRLGLKTSDLSPILNRLRNKSFRSSKRHTSAAEAGTEAESAQSDVPLENEFPVGSYERKIQDLREELVLPSNSTLANTWSQYLLLRTEELEALQGGLSENAALQLVRLGDRTERPALLETILADKWSAVKVRDKVTELLQVQSPDQPLMASASRVRSLLSPRSLSKVPADRRQALNQELETLLKNYLLTD